MSRGAVMRDDDKRLMTPDKFWAQVVQGSSDDCWEWTGRRVRTGYGQVGFSRRLQRSHRVAWQLTYGPIPGAACVLHACDNPPCCNPRHLFLGTQEENVADRVAKGRTVAAQPGERHFAAKLTNAHVRQIRAEYARALTTQQALADRWGISRGGLSKILNRKVYVDA